MSLFENDVHLKGYLGKDASTKTTRQQKSFTVLSLATKSSYKDRQTDKWVSHTDWHRVVVFGKQAEFASQLVTGNYVEVKGELRSTQYDAESGEGQSKKRRVWEIRASMVTKLERPANADAGASGQAGPVPD
jgi:single-strand DNA-binding protein